jgi:hypothetical protein
MGSHSSVASDGVWATVRVDSGPSILEEPLIVHVSFDGDIQAVRRMDLPYAGFMWATRGFAGEGDVMVMGAFTRDLDNTTRNWVVRLR